MMTAREIADWIGTLPENAEIGVDEGGLCLKVVVDGVLLKISDCDIGGIPEEIENA